MSSPSERDVDWIGLSSRRAKGKRPDYFDDPAVERLLSITMALVGEVSVMRQRLDTLERLSEAKGCVTQAEIEAFVPDRDAAYERGVLTKAYISRVMRGVQQAMEAMASEEPAVDDVIQELRDS